MLKNPRKAFSGQYISPNIVPLNYSLTSYQTKPDNLLSVQRKKNPETPVGTFSRAE